MLDNEDKRETETRYNKHGQEKRGLLVDNNNNNNNNVENANFETEEVDHNIPYYKKILKGMVTGVGFLSDAYDLFVINGVLLIIEEYYPDVAKYKSGIATSVLVGAVLGQLGFGIVADKIGRRLGFIITLALVITGSIASSLSFSLGAMNFLQCLMIWRFLLGVGVGGEYPLSATISAETSSTQKRGQTTAAVFSMQGVGSLLATIMAFLFYIMLPERLHLVWRLALAFGALPGLTMIYFRVKMEETSRFAASKNPLSVPIPSSSSSPSSPLSPSLSNTRYHATSAHEDGDAANNGQEIFAERSFVDRLGTSIRSAWRSEKFTLLRQNWTRLVGTAGSWFLLDITFYANGLFSTRIIKMIGVTELKHVLIWNIYLALAALPGYWAAVFLIDRVGRKPLQLFGFAVLGGVYLTMGLIYHQLENSSALFFFMYCLTFFVTNMGANTTTYVLPSESFPTAIRATCHGISAAFGKLGAVVGSAMMTPLLDAHGLPTVLIICAIVAFCGAVHTFFFTVETLGKTLEQINNGDNEPRRGWRRFLW